MRIVLLALLLLSAQIFAPTAAPSVLAADGWMRRDGTPSSRAELNDALARASFVLIGETHDNPHHHGAQAALLRSMIAAGRRPAVVWEMVSRDRQDAIDAWASSPEARSPDAFAHAVGWAESGWPDFALYRPIVAAAVDAGLAMVAGGLNPGETRAVAEGGIASMPARLVAAWGLDKPLPQTAVNTHLDAVFDGHCQLVPREHLGAMVDVQAVRDASLAVAMIEAANLKAADGAVLIAGRGHVREDVGVPLFLRRLAPGTDVLTIGLLEGEAGSTPPASDTPFDWTRSFPAADRPDPCTALRRHFGGRK